MQMRVVNGMLSVGLLGPKYERSASSELRNILNATTQPIGFLLLQAPRIALQVILGTALILQIIGDKGRSLHKST